jgi:predicted 3-demethylubiquinone-9 3-methyltransferase (glyoxalase superfamily)
MGEVGPVMAGTITPCLWFDGRVREAAEFYTELFPDSSVEHLDDFMSVIVVGGQRMQLLNGGPQFPFTEAVSFVHTCTDQAELDHFWGVLIADGGSESQCGWCCDKFGLSWQIIPDNMGELISNPTAVAAMMTMQKIDIAALEAARDSHAT